MFTCAKCPDKDEQIAWLRDELKRATDRLLAMTNPQAYQAVSFSPPTGEFYGSESDEQVEYGAYGQKLIVSKKQ